MRNVEMKSCMHFSDGNPQFARTLQFSNFEFAFRTFPLSHFSIPYASIAFTGEL